jgi:putative ABC transport system permease protein
VEHAAYINQNSTVMKDKITDKPPRWATRLLQWYCAPHLIEEVQGDLQEEFEYRLAQDGSRAARIDYVRSVFGFMKPFAMKGKSSNYNSNPFSPNMLKHYFLVAMRNVFRHKAFSIINIAGLALGMTCCLFIFLWIQDEKGVDNFHVNGNQLYAVYQTITAEDRVIGDYNATMRYDSLGRFIAFEDATEVIPEVVGLNFYATGYELPWGHAETLQVGDKMHKLNGARTNADFFSMFSYPVIAGDARTALSDISGMAISRKTAALYFNSPEEAIGKMVRFENYLDFVVNAVFEDLPANSTLQFDFLLNWQSHMKRLNIASPKTLATVQLAEDANPELVAEKLNRLLSSRSDPKQTFRETLGLRPYRDRYLVNNFVQGKPHGGRVEYINIFTGVAVFVLLIACINFMNLSTARSVKRSKEVGVRKVVGSSRTSLIVQFFGESILLSAVALLFSVLLCYALLPAFNAFIGKHISSPLLSPSFWVSLGVLLAITGLVAGSYPALFLSGLKPAGILKGISKFANSAIWFRKGLSVFQFVISIALLIATFVMTEQTDFIQHSHIGYDRENLIYVSVEGELANQAGYLRLKDQLGRMPGIAMIDRASEAPHAMTFVVDLAEDGKSETADDTDAIKWEGKEQRTSAGFKPMSVGYDFLPIMGLKVAEGRGFSRAYATDSSAFMINEEAVKQMGMKDPIGKWVSAWKKKGHIIGILKDYNTNSLREPIKPLIVDVKEYENFGVILIKTEPGKTTEALASIEQVYKQVNPKYAFSYQFLDQEYDKLYRNESVITKLSNSFAFLAIIISCLGLLGLVMFSAEQRTREFGIRKVLGATAANIVNLLSQDFMKLVLISFAIAAPLAGYMMHQWLLGFAYKIELSWWIYAASGGAAMLIALLTICFQAFQSATANPVNALKAD